MTDARKKMALAKTVTETPFFVLFAFDFAFALLTF
jgi:hypothetical protein